MKTLSIYEPAMCCSTGVCGPIVDPILVEIATAIKHLKANNITVNRYNLSQEPSAFIDNENVKNMLSKNGKDSLPYIFVDDELIAQGSYPLTSALYSLLDVPPPSTSKGI